MEYLVVTDSWIDERVQEVGDECHRNEQDGEEEHHGLQYRQVVVVHSSDGHVSHAWPCEYSFSYHSSC